MITIIVNVDVKSENIADFIKETQIAKTLSEKEAGCFGYDILQSLLDETKFTLVEKYKSEDAIEKHKATTHFLNWRTNVQPMMANPRTSSKSKSI